MRAVFINHCHPEMPHVCGIRLGRFAEAMAARGHEIVLLVEAYPRDADCPTPERVAAELAVHDWSAPYILPCRPKGHLAARRARAGKGGALRRYATILKSFVADNGMFADWQDGAAANADVLAHAFKPDVIWATFGNTDNWAIAQHLAKRCGAPWVADFKDNWGAFIPDGLKLLMARRFRDAAHMTVLSETHCDEAERWFGGVKSVLYSGVESVPAPPAAASAGLKITLAGSIYDENRLGRLVWGLRDWLVAAARGNVAFTYAGNDTKTVERVSAPLEDFCERHFPGYLSLSELTTLQMQASVNIYVHNERCLFHHKALELIAAGQPILSFPDETPETRRLAGEAGAALFICADREQIADAMDVVAAGNLPPADATARAEYSWTARAKVLESVLTQVIGGPA